MGYYDKATDWQVCSVLSGAVAFEVAGGFFDFDFYSPTAGMTGRLRLGGLGAGVGGNASGTVLPLPGQNPFTSINCDMAFSLDDLNGAWGRITQAGVGTGVGFGVMYLTAAAHFFSFSSFFHSQNIGGWGTSAGAGALSIVGIFGWMGVSGNTPSSGGTSVA